MSITRQEPASSSTSTNDGTGVPVADSTTSTVGLNERLELPPDSTTIDDGDFCTPSSQFAIMHLTRANSQNDTFVLPLPSTRSVASSQGEHTLAMPLLRPGAASRSDMVILETSPNHSLTSGGHTKNHIHSFFHEGLVGLMDSPLYDSHARGGARGFTPAAENGEAVLVTSKSAPRLLTLRLMLPIFFFLCCGGPSGVEMIISSGGPLLGMVSLAVFAIAFGAPFSMIISELCTVYPNDGGFVLWVSYAFGPFWGFQEGYWNWVSCTLSNAVYPLYVVQYLVQAFGAIDSGLMKYLLKVVITILCTLPTLFGVRIVGKLCMVLAFLVLVPFVILVFWCFAEARDYDLLGKVPDGRGDHGKVDVTSLVQNVFWCFDGIYMVSLFGGQVANPSHTFPRAIFISLGVSVVVYAVPLIATVAVGKLRWQDFRDDSMIDVGYMLGGPFLRGLLLASGMCSNMGMLVTSAFTQCYQINGMAEYDLLPKGCGKRHYFFETPYIAMLVNTLPVLFLLAFDMDVLVQTNNLFSAAEQILIILSALKLRVDEADIYRPSKITFGLVSFPLLMLFPLAVMGFVVVTAISTVVGAIITLAFVLIGILYGLYDFDFDNPNAEER